MKKFLVFFIAVIFVSCVNINKNISKNNLKDILKKVRPAIVKITVIYQQDYNGRKAKYEATGSGIIISSDGYVITNHHVASNAIYLECTLYNKENIPAKFVGTDPLTDISVLKLSCEKYKKYPFLKFGDSSKVKVGDTVFAIGSPYALSQIVTKGIISNPSFILPSIFDSEFKLDGENVGSVVKWIGHDAAIYPGNSGGALINDKGEIIGINEISLGISGAIPSNLAKKIVKEIIKYGKVKRSWFGFYIQPILKSSPIKKGALVNTVIKDSPAQKAGLRSGDIITQINGKNITVKFEDQIPVFNNFIMNLPIGKKVNFQVYRNGKYFNIFIASIERPKIIPRSYEFKKWGITARNISFIEMKEEDLKTDKGVYVTSVKTGGPCGIAKPSIKRGDIIISVDGNKISNVKDLRKITTQLLKHKKSKNVMVKFYRGKEILITVVNVGKVEESNTGIEAKKAWIPIETEVLTRPIAKILGLEDKGGVIITRIYNHPVIKKTGLNVGDVITQIDGIDIEAREPEDEDVFSSMIKEYPVGEVINLTVYRGKKKKIVPVKLISSLTQPSEMKRYKDNFFEFSVRNISEMDILKNDWNKNIEGVIVSSVIDNGWASLGGLKVDDIILEINGNKIKNIEDVRKILTKLKEKKPETIVFKVRRKVKRLFLEIKPLWKD